ncbi:MAG: hypothetical protein HFG54_09055 [Lachnospiraceae bacterium]|nr:hypothetical protein [Lachnospiraceae bacterium]
MNYTKFLETVRQELKKRLGADQELIVRPVPKNNGILLDGLSIHTSSTLLAPTVYLNPYYEQYQEGMSIQDICEDILGLFQSNSSSDGMDEDALTDFESMKSRVMMRLIHSDSNRELLSDIPHITYLDLSIVFYLFLERNVSGQITALIHNDFLEAWQTNAQTLFRLALINTPAVYPAEIRSMTNIMKEIARQNLGTDYNEEYLDQLLGEEDLHTPLYVLSNRNGIYGACCMIYKNTLKNFADSLGSDLLIIPSSIHEVLLTPNESGLSYDYLNSMVENINRSEVPVEDQLSDHIYLYTRADDRLRIISP